MKETGAPLTFGVWLRQQRRVLDLTQDELAQRLNCARITVRRMEAGQLRPSKQLAELIAKQFDVPEDQREAWVKFARGLINEPASELVDERRQASVGGSQTRLRDNLPAPLTRFIGRKREIAEVKQLVKGNRLVMLTGAGGCGKTRLALEVAASVLNDPSSSAGQAFLDGVWLVEFAPVADAELVTQTVAAALGVTEQPGASLTDLLVAQLRGWQVLLIFDNCEHLVRACAALAERLLRTCPKLQVLATSREPLHVEGEVTWRVPPLTDEEAMQLFVERARGKQPEFEVTDRSAVTVAHVCRKLDSIPLAIELAAARVNTLSVEQIAERLDDRFGLLTSGSRTALPRHQTLRAAIAWSFDLLTPEERHLLAQLSVFAGGFSAEAAEAVSDQSNVLDLLSKLVDKSLVIADVRRDAARYHLLDTIRQFALEQLRAKDEEGAARNRRSAYFLKLAEAAEIGMRGEKLQAWSARLEQDLDNLRAALTWSYETGKFETCLRLAGALWLFWYVQDHAREGLAWFDKLLAGAPTPPSVRAKALYGAAMMAFRIDEWRRMAAFAQESLSLCRGLNDPIGVAFSLICLGFVSLLELDHQRAYDMYEEAQRLLRASQHLWGVGLVMLCLGELLLVQGKFAEGDAALEESLSLLPVLDWWLLYYTLYDMVGSALAQGDLTRAKALAQQRLALGRESGQMRMCCRALRELGHVALQEGDYRGAIESFEECIALFQKFGYSEPSITHALADLGLISLLQGDCEAATQRFHAASAFYQETGNDGSLGYVQVCLGYTSLAQGDPSSAYMHFRQGVKLSHRVGNTGGLAGGLAGIGWVWQAQGNMQQAVRLCGFAARFSGVMSITWLPTERADYERILAEMRAQLDDPNLAAAWAKGQHMTPEQAVEYALSEDE